MYVHYLWQYKPKKYISLPELLENLDLSFFFLSLSFGKRKKLNLDLLYFYL